MTREIPISRAVVLASTAESDAIAIRADSTPHRPGDGKHRRVVAYCAPDISKLRFAGLLRELADKLDRR